MFEGLRRVLGVNTVTADEAGFSTDFMEAQAFAYLAARRMKELPSTFAGTTGVSEPVICGLSANANSRQPGAGGCPALGYSAGLVEGAPGGARGSTLTVTNAGAARHRGRVQACGITAGAAFNRLSFHMNFR